MKSIRALLRVTARVTTAAILSLSLPLSAGGVASAEAPVFDPDDVFVYPSQGLAAEKSTDYRVWVNGKEIFCRKSYAYTMDKYFWESRPATTGVAPGTALEWEGSDGTARGRPVTPLTYCSFDFKNKVQVRVSFEQPLRDAKKADPEDERPFIDTSVVDVRPLSAAISPTVTTVTQPDGSTNPGITFTLDADAPCELVRGTSRAANSPCQLSIEPGKQTKRPLHLFANPMEAEVPVIDGSDSTVKVMEPNNSDDPYHTVADMKLSGKQNTLYFKPGVHRVDPIVLTVSREQQNHPEMIYVDQPTTTIYVAGGAVVYLRPQYVRPTTTTRPEIYNRPFTWVESALIESHSVSNLTIKGRGILSGKLALDGNPGEDVIQRARLIRLNSGHNVRVEGVTLEEPGDRALELKGINRTVPTGTATVSNIKVIGHFGNSDAVVLVNTHNGTVENSFAHNADNGMQVKAHAGGSAQDIEFRNNVIWSDTVGSFGLFGEAAANITNVTYRDSVVIHMLGTAVAPAVGLRLTGPGHASDFTFENITVEHTSCGTCAPIKVINNWNDWGPGFSTTHRNDPYFPTTTEPDKVTELQRNGAIRNITFRNVHVLDAANSDVVVEPYDTGTPIDNVSFDTVSVNQRTIVDPYDTQLYTNGRVRGTQTPVRWKGITNTTFRYRGCVPDSRGRCSAYAYLPGTTTQP